MSAPPNDDHARNAFGHAAGTHISDANPSAWTPVPWEKFAADLSLSHPHYRVTGFIDCGGMGAVYRAEETSEKGEIRQLAIKALRWDALSDDNYLARFEREISLLQKIDHPGIVAIKDHGRTAGGIPFFAMPFISGQTLREILVGPRLPQSRTLQIMEQACAAVAHAHLKGIIHRDLKPANIFVTFSAAGEPHVTILDFGVARERFNQTRPPTLPHHAPGTHGYMAPEVLKCEPASYPADIFALGVISYELFTGGDPSASFEEPALEPIVAKAMHQFPGKRYQTATEFSDKLRANSVPATGASVAMTAFSPMPPPLPRTISVPPALPRPPGVKWYVRKRYLIPAAVLMVLCISGVLMGIIVNGRGPQIAPLTIQPAAPEKIDLKLERRNQFSGRYDQYADGKYNNVSSYLFASDGTGTAYLFNTPMGSFVWDVSGNYITMETINREGKKVVEHFEIVDPHEIRQDGFLGVKLAYRKK